MQQKTADNTVTKDHLHSFLEDRFYWHLCELKKANE